MAELPYLEWLARKYLVLGESSGCWAHYLKAHGLANACLREHPTDESLRFVYEIEQSWYKLSSLAHPLTLTEHEQLVDKYHALLVEFTDETSEDFESLAADFRELDIDNIFSESNIGRAVDASQRLFEKSERCSNTFVKVSRVIIGSSVELLAKRGLHPPCNFAVIGLGSVARGEATPYSDLEYAFIVDSYSDLDYFMKLAVDTYFRIGTIGESPLKGFNITELEQEPRLLTKCDPTKSGFRIDGIRDKAGNIPTGNVGGQRLILTVADFLELYRKELMKPVGKIAGDMSDLLSMTVLIYSSEGETSRLHSLLHEQITCECEKLKNDSFVRRKRFKTFSLDVENHNFLPEFDIMQQPVNTDIELKMDIYRYPTLLATNLSIALDLRTVYPWDTYALLRDKGILSDEIYHCLTIVLALVIYLRTSAYIAQGTQSELMSLYTSTLDDCVADRFHVSLNAFVTLGVLIAPIKKSISLGTRNCCSIAEVMRQIEIDQTDFMSQVEVLYFTGRYQIALKKLSRSLNEDIESMNCCKFVQFIQEKYGTTGKSDTVEKSYMELCSCSLYYNQRFDSALGYLEYLTMYDHESVMDKIQLDWFIVDCNAKLHRYGRAKELQERALTQLKQELGLEEDQSLLDCEMSRLEADGQLRIFYQALGAFFHELGDHSNSLAYHTKFLDATKRLYRRIAEESSKEAGSKHVTKIRCVVGELPELDSAGLGLKFTSEYIEYINHTDIANAYHIIGVVLSDMDDYTASLDYHRRALLMRQCLYGTETAHPEIAESYSEIGLTYTNMGDLKKALPHHNKGLELRKAIYGVESGHDDIARSHRNIAGVHYALGEYAVSLDHFQTALSMRQAFHREDKHHHSLATIHQYIGNIYLHTARYDMSLEHHKKALEIRRIIYSQDGNHPEIVFSLSHIGNALLGLGDHRGALQYFTESLEMEQAIHGESSIHMAESHISIANVYLSMDEHTLAEEHFEKSAGSATTFSDRESSHRNTAASICSRIAKVFSDMGNHNQSIRYWQKALERLMMVRGDEANQSDISGIYDEIGMAYLEVGEHAASLEYHNKSLAMRLAIHDGNSHHPDVADSYDHLSRVYLGLDEPETAVECLTHSLEIKQELYRGEHCDIATSHQAIGRVFLQLGEHTKALENHRKCLEMRLSLSEGNTKEHGIAESYGDIGEVYTEVKEYVAALYHFMMSLTIQQSLEENNGDQLDIAETCTRIGEAYSNLEGFSTAFEFYMKALSALKRASNDDVEALLAECYSGAGTACFDKGDYSASLKYLRKALKLHKALRGNHTIHEDIADSLNRIGNVYTYMGSHKLSHVHYLRSLNMLKVLHRGHKNHPNLVLSYNNIGSLYSRDGRSEDALFYYYNQALVRAHRGQHSQLLSEILANIAQARMEMREHNISVKFLKIAIKKMATEDTKLQANICILMGESFLHLAQWRKAWEYLHLALCFGGSLPACKQTTLFLARTQLNIALLHLNLINTHLALEHSELSLRLVEELHVNERDISPEYTRLDIRTRLLVNTLRLVKDIQYQFDCFRCPRLE